MFENRSVDGLQPRIIKKLFCSLPILSPPLQHASHKPEEVGLVLPRQVFLRAFQTRILCYRDISYPFS